MSREKPIYDTDDFEEMDLERKRNLRSSFVNSGIASSAKHKAWLAKQAASASQNSENRRSVTPPGSNRPTKPATPFLQSTNKNGRDPTTQPIKIYSAVEKKWYRVEVKFDSGTRENWISAPVFALLKQDVEIVPPTIYLTFNGVELESSELARQVLWHGDGLNCRTRQTDFRVADGNAPFQVLLGSEFLFGEGIFSFNEPALVLTKKKESQADKEMKEKNRMKANAEAKALAEERRLVEAQKSEAVQQGKK